MIEYGRIVFLQNEQADEALQILNDQGTEAAIEHLAQWDNADAVEVTEEPSSGDDDDVFEDEHYRLSWNSKLNYIGLEAILETDD